MSAAIPPLPQYAFMAWCLVKRRYDFAFIFIFIIINLLLPSTYVHIAGDTN